MIDGMVDILLVEDNAKDEELALHALRKARVANRIYVVRDGAEALDYMFCKGVYSERKIADVPKVVLLDLKLPKVDGQEVLRQLKADARTEAIPVVILTSSREERDLLESYALGANSYIVKPVDFDQFNETVRQLGLYWVVLNQLPRVQAE